MAQTPQKETSPPSSEHSLPVQGKRPSPGRDNANSNSNFYYQLNEGQQPTAVQTDIVSRKTKRNLNRRKGSHNTSTSPSGSSSSTRKQQTEQPPTNNGRWTGIEHYKFLEALKLFGKEWQKVQQHVNTRTST